MRRLLYLSSDPGVPVLGHKGASVHVRALVRAFAGAGVSVVVASPRVEAEGDTLDAPTELVEIDPVVPGRYGDVGSVRATMDAQAAQIDEVARAWQADAIYERYSLFSDGGVRAAHRHGLPHLLEVNAPLRDEARRFRSLPYPEEAAEVEARVFAATDRLIAVSGPLAGWLVSVGVERERIEVVPNGVDPRQFSPPQRRSGGPFVVGFAGSLKPWHGVELLLNAFSRARETVPQLRLEIVGSGPSLPPVEQAAALAANIVLHGPLPHQETIRLMSGWDVGVAPYLPLPDFYFSPLKLVEYMAAGLCPVASELGQIGVLLGGGARGVLVRAGDMSELAGALVELAADRPRAHEIGGRARAWAFSELTWERNARRALEMLGARESVGAR